jgi:uncharacterized protein with GYD domain
MMAKFMVQFSYSDSGRAGFIKDGGTKRREATKELVKSLGGKLLAYYFAFGDYDGLAIIDDLDNVEMVAGLLAASSSGTVSTKTTVLIDPEDVDKALKKTVQFRKPGE